MRKKEIFWIVALVVLGGVYVRYFTRWLAKKEIGISASLRPNRRGHSPVYGVYFTLNGDYPLTHLKVVPYQGKTFNPLAPPVWDLVSDSNSPPLRALRYGQPIPGMKSELKGARPAPLTPGTVYRLILTSGTVTGHTDFRTKLLQ